MVNGTMSVTVDAIEAFRKQLMEANVGDNIGVLLRNAERSQLKRGDVLSAGVTIF